MPPQKRRRTARGASPQAENVQQLDEAVPAANVQGDDSLPRFQNPPPEVLATPQSPTTQTAVGNEVLGLARGPPPRPSSSSSSSAAAGEPRFMDPYYGPFGSPNARQVPARQETNPPPGFVRFMNGPPRAERRCKCWDFLLVPNAEIREMMNERDRQATQHGVWYLANRCAYFNRAVGCRLGDSCDYCHVHPRTAGEQSSVGQRWSHGRQSYVPLGRRERRAQMEMLQETQPWRERLRREKRILMWRIRAGFAHNDSNLSVSWSPPPPDPALAVADAPEPNVPAPQSS